MKAATQEELLLERYGFRKAPTGEPGMAVYVARVGVFQIRVRLPLAGYVKVTPGVWLGVAINEPLVEQPSKEKYRTALDAVHDALGFLRMLVSTQSHQVT